ncbi:MAG: thermonuclease family protein [Deltaproteobacteria bacterium]|nr:thermonuclease family protein [Deltaproteobacteria bacterium]
MLALSNAIAGLALAHPGGRDAEGCHTCRTKCEQYGLSAGERHCHGEGEAAPPAPARPELRATPRAASHGTSLELAYVDKVLDGDTIKVRAGGEKLTIRVLGIDCPESKRNRKCKADKTGCAWQIPWGMKAAKRAAALLKHQQVTLECEGKCGAGRFGRPLRYVRLPDGRDFGQVMIEEGFCADYGWKYPHPRGRAYRRAQAPVQAAGLGVWQEARWK